MSDVLKDLTEQQRNEVRSKMAAAFLSGRNRENELAKTVWELFPEPPEPMVPLRDVVPLIDFLNAYSQEREGCPSTTAESFRAKYDNLLEELG